MPTMASSGPTLPYHLFGALLRQYRRKAGLSQGALAERAGMSVRAIGYLERGSSRPYPDTLSRLIEALALTPAQQETLTDAAFAPEVATPESALAMTVGGPIPLSLPSVLPLVGREQGLAILRDRLAACLAEQGGLVLLSGEAGVGKSALAEALCREAAGQDVRVLVGRCYDLSETPPYGPWTEVRSQFPLADNLPPLPSAFHTDARSSIQFFAEVRDFFVAAAARQPIVLLLDDLQWADPASLDLLRFLARALGTSRMLILAIYRIGEIDRHHPLAQLLPLLVREAHTTRLTVLPLPVAALRELVRSRYALAAGDEERLVAYLAQRTEGNALFATELLHALEEGGVLVPSGTTVGDLTGIAVPVLLRQVIEGRVVRLGSAAEDLLCIAAVIGQEAPLALWATVAAADERTVEEVAERALVAGLLIEAQKGEQLAFAHALIREALYESIPRTRRRRIHRATGEALAREGDAAPDTVAYHFQHAGDARAAEWLVRAGERARASFAYVTAVERMQEAVALLDGPGDAALAASLCLQICWMLRTSNGPQSLRYAEEAVKRAEGAGDPVLAGVARCRLGHSYINDGEFMRGISELRSAVAALEALPPEAWERTIAPRWYVAAMEGDRSSVTDGRSLLALPLAIVGACGEALVLLGGTLDIGDALATATREKLIALRIVAEYLGRPDVAMRMYAEFGYVMRAEVDWYTLAVSASALVRTVLIYHADDLAYREEMARAAEEAWARAQALYLTEPFPVRAVRFLLDFIEGAWDAAQTSAAMILQRGGPSGRPAPVTPATIARLRGSVEESRRYVQGWFPAGAATEPGTQVLLPSLQFLHLGGMLALDAGDLTGAREWAEASDRWLAWSGAVLGQSEGQALWSQYYRLSGDTEEAHEHAERALVHATEPRQPLALIAAHRLLGELATEFGDYESAARHLDASLALADACQAPYERSLTMLAMAELRAAMGQHDAARTLLDVVKTICEPLGAKPTLARADALVARLT